MEAFGICSIGSEVGPGWIDQAVRCRIPQVHLSLQWISSTMNFEWRYEYDPCLTAAQVAFPLGKSDQVFERQNTFSTEPLQRRLETR